MSSTGQVIALKEAGTTPPAEGMLARFADVQAIKSVKDASRLTQKCPALILVDLRMPTLRPPDVVETLRKENSKTLIVLLDFEQPPATVRRQLSHLATLVAPHQGKPLDIPRIARILKSSQESLSRILNVSTKTAHRWMKGTKPRRRPELARLSHLLSLLLETLPSENAVADYLNHRNPSLGGETPIALLLRGEFDPVEADISAVREGVYL